ncbi:hypothetical protein EON63_23805, partial [archaeon]
YKITHICTYICCSCGVIINISIPIHHRHHHHHYPYHHHTHTKPITMSPLYSRSTFLQVLRDAEGQVTSLECRYDPSSLRGAAPTLMPKPKGIVQWLSPLSSSACELRIYDKLFTAVTPGTERSFLEDLNPRSLQVITNARVEDSVLQHVDFSMLRNQPAAFQFERVGYFSVDRDSEQGGRLVFNRVVTLKEGWKPE